jgi:release factor glutamine methyltransferase
MSADQEIWTIGRLLNWTTEYLSNTGSTSPRLDAEVLLAEARCCERIDLYTAFDETADEKMRTVFRDLVRRRAAGTPVAYLVGQREFYSMAFEVTPAVLVPRPETEFLIVALLDQVKQEQSKRTLRIADIGTGSGVLAVTAAVQLNDCQVTATDVSSAALDVARRNASRHRVSDRIDWREGNLFAALEAEVEFDYVISNPPYVSEEEYQQLPSDVRDHEPRGALVAGERGTEVIEQLVSGAVAHTKPGAWLLVEISPMIEQAVSDSFATNGAWQLERITKDHAGLARVVQARRV